MQWDATKSAGFSDAKPWVPVADNFRDENVDSFRKDKGSLYWLYRRLINFRRKHVALAEGSYKPLMRTSSPTNAEIRERNQTVFFQIANGKSRQACSVKTRFPTQQQASRYLRQNWTRSSRWRGIVLRTDPLKKAV
jgi:glycosidase